MQPDSCLCGAVMLLLVQILASDASGQRQELGMTFTRHPQPLAAPLGDEVNFECSLNLPAERFEWRHRPVNSDKWHSVPHVSTTAKTSRLIISFDDKSKAGSYRCLAFYGPSGLASDPAELTLARIERFSDKSDAKLRVPVGSTVPITCPVPTSVPEAVVEFLRNGEPILTPNLIGGKTMVIENARPSDAGAYSCTATNYITSEKLSSNSRTILVLDASQSPQRPFFLKPLQSEYRVLAGRNITLECFGGGFPLPRVSWSKLGSPLPRKSVTTSMGLTIVDVQPSDRGEYDCVWANRLGQVKSVIILTVVEPPRVVKGPKALTFFEGGELDLSCLATGQPKPSLEWLINGESLVRGQMLEMKGPTLTISDVEKKHAGIVQCVATNEFGSHSGYNLLRVNPKQHVGGPGGPGGGGGGAGGGTTEARPEYGSPNSSHKHTRTGGRRRGKENRKKGTDVLVPPDQPNVTRLSDVSVMVRWAVPENKGLEIQFFKVQYKELGQKNGRQAKWMTANSEIPPHVRSFEVTDLQPDHTYRFRIAAVYSNNDNKLSPNSVRFHLNRDSGVESNKMPIPLLTNTEALGPNEVLLVWQNPDRNATIDGFYVYYRASTSAGEYVKTTVEGRNSSSITIGHLQPDTTYEFKVQSFSVGAASDFSKILSERTQKAAVVEPPVQQVLAETKLQPDESERQTNVYAVIGGALGGLLLLAGLAAGAVLYKRSKQKPSRESSQSEGKPITNGRVLNGGVTDSKINITPNPLAGLEANDEPIQPKSGQQSSMEMASFLNGQNNNGSGNHNSGDGGDSTTSVVNSTTTTTTTPTTTTATAMATTNTTATANATATATTVNEPPLPLEQTL